MRHATACLLWLCYLERSGCWGLSENFCKGKTLTLINIFEAAAGYQHISPVNHCCKLAVSSSAIRLRRRLLLLSNCSASYGLLLLLPIHVSCAGHGQLAVASCYTSTRRGVQDRIIDNMLKGGVR